MFEKRAIYLSKNILFIFEYEIGVLIGKSVVRSPKIPRGLVFIIFQMVADQIILAGILQGSL
jgi:hypothetical protein